MTPYYPELLATPVPRYTSYPTAAEFGSGIGADDFEAALATASGDISLYLHIPFCEQLCWYCGCNTARTNRRERLEAYLEALMREIALVGQRLPAGARVKRVSYGGGSPNALAPAEFAALHAALDAAFPLDTPVVSVELDPRAMPPGWELALGDAGVRRASLGVQTFAPALQAAIGRVQPSHLIEACTALLRRAGVTSLNYDLMYGLPGQTWADLDDSLARTIALGADRVALFGYAHVPHLIARQRRIDAAALPDQAMRFEHAGRGRERLLEAGYVEVGFDHFALPGDPLARAVGEGRLHRNFQGFTDDGALVLIGLGASAISSFPTLLAQNDKSAGRYRMLLSQDRLPANRGAYRSAEDRVRGAAIEALLCRGEAKLDDRLALAVLPRLPRFADRGLIAIEGTTVRLLAGAEPYARVVAAQFDGYRDASTVRFSSAV